MPITLNTLKLGEALTAAGGVQVKDQVEWRAYLGCNERLNSRHVNLFGRCCHVIVGLHIHPIGWGRIESTGEA